VARSSKYTRDLMRALRNTGHDRRTGPTAAEVIRAADEPVRPGAKKKAPRPYVKKRKDGPPVVYVRAGDDRKSLNVVLRKGMSLKAVEIAVDLQLAKYKTKRDAEDLEERSPEDLTLSAIYDRWVETERNTKSAGVNYNRALYGRHLFDHRKDMRLGDLTYEFGHNYVDHRVDELPPGAKKDSATVYAIMHLRCFQSALDLYYAGVRTDEIRRFAMPEFEKEKFAFYLTWDWLMRLIMVARGWEWDLANECWLKRWDEASGRWVLCYDRGRRDEALVRYICLYTFSGTRDSTIPTLAWATELGEGTIFAAEGIIVRRPPGHERTNKRAEPAHLIGPLPSLVKRWERDDQLLLTPHVIHGPAGEKVDDLRNRFDAVAARAGLPWLTQHHLKHTGATLLTYAGLSRDDLADAFSTLASTLYRDYVHLQFLWKKPFRKAVTNSDLTLLRLRRIMAPGKAEWLKQAARVKQEHEERERQRLEIKNQKLQAVLAENGGSTALQENAQ
jgi:hypothetical protein